jgi:hypothetical protein
MSVASGAAPSEELDLTPWREHLVLRELVATMATLTSRVLSYGNREALREAGSAMEDLLSLLAQPGGCGSLISLPAVETLLVLLKALQDVTPATFAKLALSSVDESLAVAYADMKSESERVEMAYGGRHLPHRSVEEVLVEVGPTIGLGDELLFASAIAERVASAPHVKITASSRRRDLWNIHRGFSTIAARPPLGLTADLVGRSSAERRRTGVVRLDFLPATSGAPPYVGPSDVAYGGTWTMGKGQGEFVEPREAVHHVWRYPDALPPCRWLESRWAAGRIVPGSQLDVEPLEPVRRVRGRAPRVVLQVLTAKPSLMFPPRFYVRALEPLCQELGGDVHIRLLPAPSDADSTAVANASAALAGAFGAGSVEIVPCDGLDAVIAEIRQADLLIGPDSFPTHVADLFRVPQVVIGHHEHVPWITPLRPRITLHPSRAGVDALVGSVGSAAWALLEATTGRLDAAARLGSHDWSTQLGALDGWVRSFLHDPRSVEPGSAPVAAVGALGPRLASEPWARMSAIRVSERVPATRLDISRYEHDEDAGAAVVRWYHRLATTKLSGLLVASHVDD